MCQTATGKLADQLGRLQIPPRHVRRALRVLTGASQAAVGEMVGVRGPTISRWETGTRVPRAAAAYLAVLDDLLGVVVDLVDRGELGPLTTAQREALAVIVNWLEK